MGKPKWLNKDKTTRARSGKQENRLAKTFGGRPTSNSGATFNENDVVTPDFEIEAKTTYNKQFPLKAQEIKNMNKKCKFGKVALFIVEFEKESEEVVVIRTADFLRLLGLTKF